MTSNLNNTPEPDLDNWFNDLDKKSLDIINQDLITEEEATSGEIFLNDTHTPIKILPRETIVDISQEHTYVYVEDIIKTDLTSLDSVYIIQYECSIAYFIKAMIENINKTFYCDSKEGASDMLNEI